MQVNNYYLYNNIEINTPKNNKLKLVYDKDSASFQKHSAAPNFQGNPITAITDYLKYKELSYYIKLVAHKIHKSPDSNNLLFRNLSMEVFEGIQYGIDVFKGLSMKDIQYLSENLHVITVKRGCNNMCGYCYAAAKPSNREMSWEDFTSITGGFKKLKKRLCDLPIFGENMHQPNEISPYTTTELFYDADCINLALKDKNGKLHDFRDLVTELNEGLGRKSVFDTSGWAPENKTLQKRAEEYAEYFSKPENMNKLGQFNISFNVFSASNVASVKAARSGNAEKASRLQEKYTDRIANALFTFTPLLKSKDFQILQRCFGVKARNAEGFDIMRMMTLHDEVLKKVGQLYEKDLNGAQKYIKSPNDIETNMYILNNKMLHIDTALNSSGRMQEFMKAFNIKAPMQDHTETTKKMYQDLQELGRYHRVVGMKLIDADGRVYHMDYARFFPTEIQLNLSNKTPTPPLANTRKECVVTKEIINRPEIRKIY